MLHPFLKVGADLTAAGWCSTCLSSAVLAFAQRYHAPPAQAGRAPPVLSILSHPVGVGASVFVPALVRRRARAFLRRLFGGGGFVPSVRGAAYAPVARVVTGFIRESDPSAASCSSEAVGCIPGSAGRARGRSMPPPLVPEAGSRSSHLTVTHVYPSTSLRECPLRS